MSLALRAIGTAVPDTCLDQEAAAQLAAQLCCRTEEQKSWLASMYHNTGIDRRFLHCDQDVVDDIRNGTHLTDSCFVPTGLHDDAGPSTAQRMQAYQTVAADLSCRASRSALSIAHVIPRSITHLISVSCTGFAAPGFDQSIIHQLQLSPYVARTHVGFMGCHGAFNALRVASAFSAADPNSRILICATELCSLHYHYGWDPQRMVANALFADGAAAVVATPRSDNNRWTVIGHGSMIFPDSTGAMSWTIGDHGFEMKLARKVPELIAQSLRPWLVPWLHTHQLQLADVRSWAIHPGGRKILDVVADSLGLSEAAMAPSRLIFSQFGNMSSPTVLFILNQLMRSQAPGPCVALGFGPGLTVEAMLLTVPQTHA